MKKLSFLLLALCLLLQIAFPSKSFCQSRTRIAIIGLNHDHVWGLLHDIANTPEADLVAIAENRQELVEKAKSQVPATVKFYSDYVQMLD